MFVCAGGCVWVAGMGVSMEARSYIPHLLSSLVFETGSLHEAWSSRTWQDLPVSFHPSPRAGIMGEEKGSMPPAHLFHGC